MTTAFTVRSSALLRPVSRYTIQRQQARNFTSSLSYTPFLHTLQYASPVAIATSLRFSLLPAISELWESILRAVPKKKQSHSRKRMRQLAGKALQDVISLGDCPGCGQKKRSHHLCPSCVDEIKDMWKANERSPNGPISEGTGVTPEAETTR